VLALAAVLIASRPGHMNLLLGQVTAQVAIGAYVALRWARTRPLLAGLGLALATLKPTYGVPLAALMLFGRGDVIAVAVGTAVSVALCLLALVPLVHAAGGVVPFAASLASSAGAFSAEGTSNAWSGFARIDAVALLARVMGRVPDGWTELALGLAIVAWLVAYRGSLEGLEVPLQPLIFWFAVTAAFGWSVGRLMLFPVAYFYFAVNVWYPSPLQHLTVWVMRGVLAVTGPAAVIQGDVIHLSNGTFKDGGRERSM